MKKGIALILITIIVALSMAIVLSAAGIFIAELVASQNIDRSTVAFYVADAGIEGELYADRIMNPRTGGSGTVQSTDDCLPNHNGINDGNENGDTCLDKLSNDGYYQYTIVGDVGARVVEATGLFKEVKRTIRIDY